MFKKTIIQDDIQRMLNTLVTVWGDYFMYKCIE